MHVMATLFSSFMEFAIELFQFCIIFSFIATGSIVQCPMLAGSTQYLSVTCSTWTHTTQLNDRCEVFLTFISRAVCCFSPSRLWLQNLIILAYLPLVKLYGIIRCLFDGRVGISKLSFFFRQSFFFISFVGCFCCFWLVVLTHFPNFMIFNCQSLSSIIGTLSTFNGCLLCAQYKIDSALDAKPRFDWFVSVCLFCRRLFLCLQNRKWQFASSVQRDFCTDETSGTKDFISNRWNKLGSLSLSFPFFYWICFYIVVIIFQTSPLWRYSFRRAKKNSSYF